MAKIIYLQDRKNGVHCYTPEMGDRKPDIEMSARVGHFGGYYVTTNRELKGRGITSVDCYQDGKYKYKCTVLAFSKLEAQYPIKMECLLD
jgi:hypothetical protein